MSALVSTGRNVHLKMQREIHNNDADQTLHRAELGNACNLGNRKSFDQIINVVV